MLASLALSRAEYGRAMPMALCLNEVDLIRAVWHAVPPDAVPVLAAALPPPYLPRLLAFLAAEIDVSRHVHAILLWLRQLMLFSIATMAQWYGRILVEMYDEWMRAEQIAERSVVSICGFEEEHAIEHDT